MPVLGSTSPTPQRFVVPAPGSSFPHVPGTYTSPDGAIVVPGGALDSWFEYKATGGVTRGDFIDHGDSTAVGAGGNYAWSQRLRDRAVTDGLADGGKGFFAGAQEQIVYDSPEVNGFISSTFGGGFPDAHDLTGGQVYYDSGSPAGHTLVLQFIGTSFRIWYSVRGNSGEFTYTIDGGSPVTVTCALVDHPECINAPESRYVAVTGLTDDLHEIVITNLGGPEVDPPTWAGGTDHDAGSLPADTTYRYVVTSVTASGESLPSAAQTFTTEAAGFPNHEIAVVITAIGGTVTDYNVYRAPGASGGTFELIKTITASGGTYDLYHDTGVDTPAPPSPPVTNTAGRNSALGAIYIAFSGFRQTGFSTQNYATSGHTFDLLVAGTQKWWDAFGLSWTVTLPTLSQRKNPALLTPFDTPPTALNPVLASIELGFNDLTTSAALTTYTDGIECFNAGCQAANCSGIVLSGQLPYNAQWPTDGADVFAAMKASAIANGLVFVDLFFPIAGSSLAYTGPTDNPHLTKLQYQAQADYLWDNLLGL